MPEVIDLVRADRALAELLQVPRDVGRRTGEERHPGTGEGDLGGGREDEDPVRVSGSLGHPQHVQRGVLGVGQVVHGVGVVPEDPEVRGRCRHRDQGSRDLFGVDHAGGVRVRRHDPDPLDGRIVGYQLAHLVQVRTVVAERHREHLDAVLLAEREVPVVAGHRADELDRAAEPRASESAVPLSKEKTSVSCMIARLALSPATSCSIGTLSSGAKICRISRQPLQAAVVTAVGAGHVDEVVLARQRQQLVRQLHLSSCRLPPGQVELEPLGHQLVVRRLELGVQVAEFLVAELGQGHRRFRWSMRWASVGAGLS